VERLVARLFASRFATIGADTAAAICRPCVDYHCHRIREERSAGSSAGAKGENLCGGGSAATATPDRSTAILIAKGHEACRSARPPRLVHSSSARRQERHSPSSETPRFTAPYRRRAAVERKAGRLKNARELSLLRSVDRIAFGCMPTC
jgi:hypothetical protein